jgi:hypothetical protein
MKKPLEDCPRGDGGGIGSATWRSRATVPAERTATDDPPDDLGGLRIRQLERRLQLRSDLFLALAGEEEVGGEACLASLQLIEGRGEAVGRFGFLLRLLRGSTRPDTGTVEPGLQPAQQASLQAERHRFSKEMLSAGWNEMARMEVKVRCAAIPIW